MSEIVESLWQKLYTTGFKVDYQNLWNYCHDNGFVYAMTGDYTSEEQHQLFNWLEEHLEQKSEEDVIDFFCEYMNAEI